MHYFGGRTRAGQLLLTVAVVGAISGAVAPWGRAEEMPVIRDKTLVAWVCLADLGQKGGSALTLDDRRGGFDGIVFGELADARWMAGSDQWRRSEKDQAAWPEETAGPDTVVQIAIVYRGNEISICRDGKPYAEYSIEKQQSFEPDSVVVMGLRHLEATNRACLAGAIEDARIYDTALSEAQIAALRPGAQSDPEPLAWWSFGDGRVTDRMGRFPEATLFGGARIEGGRLVLDGRDSYLVATPSGASGQWLKQSNGNDDTAAVRRHRAALLADPQRPAYHFVTPEGCCMPFDPNGAIFWRGRYHLCYIFQDERGHCWGHASSKDLVHWRFHTPALFPSPGDVDRGIFSGNCFVNLKGEATMLYHGVDAGNCIATCSEDDLEHWNKLPSNPIVPNPKEGDPGFGKYASWDPHGWAENDTYYAIFGGNPGSGVPATLFRSKDIENWEYIGPILDHDMPGVQPDDDISCPDFFEIGGKHMLLCISHKRGCRYYLGRWENERFYPESHAWMNWPGGTFFAPESLLDDQGRRIMWAWVLDMMPGQQPPESGWSGVMSLPRMLWLAEDGTLRMAPVPELDALRMNHRNRGDIALTDGTEVILDQVRGDCLELALDIDPGSAKEVGLRVRRSPGGEEETVIAYDHTKGVLRVDFSRSTQDGYLQHMKYVMGGDNGPVTAQEAPFTLADGERLGLRVFLDRSIIEVFANERQAIVQRIDPSRPDSLGVVLYANGGAASATLDTWDMAPSNPW